MNAKTSSAAMNAFAVFGLPPTTDLDRATLEARYLELSRATHPDHHAAGDADAAIALLQQAAAVNDAYRILRDRWTRAEAVLMHHAPQALEQHKTLAPAFLLAALELAEEVASVARGSVAAHDLAARLQSMVDDDWRVLRQALLAQDWAQGATRLHQSRYHRKALRDLSP